MQLDESRGPPAGRTHDLRTHTRTYGTLPGACSSAANVKAVQRILGQASAAMTPDVY